MLRECIEGLEIREDGLYVDLTFGGGGHSREIVKYLKEGKLFSFDQDDDALPNADTITSSSFTFIQANFRHFKRYLKMHGIAQVDGILADLGISSHQIDEPTRGFSTRFDAELDMRMDRSMPKSARDLVNEYSAEQLHRILGMYGEVKNAKSLALAIVAARTTRAIDRVEGLRQVAGKLAPRGKENKYLAQVFQALRIEVNDEMKALEEMLQQCGEMLKPGGRLVIMSYHSLEDRLVKNYMLKGNVTGKVEKDFYGNLLRPLEPVTRKPLTASPEELAANSRARSAKLRVAEKKESNG